jgi:hypothetical protein
MINVEMIGQRGGGSIEVGDEVEVYGRWTDPNIQGNIQAWEIRVTDRYSAAQGKKVPLGAVIRARKPFPQPVALAAVILAFAALVWALSYAKGF